MYYRIIDSCNDWSDFAESNADNAFPHGATGSSQSERFRYLRTWLQSEGRILEARLFIRLEKLFGDTGHTLDPYVDWISYASQAGNISNDSGPSLTTRLADTKLDLAEELCKLENFSKARDEADEALALMMSISPDAQFVGQYPRFHVRYHIIEAKLELSRPILTQVLMQVVIAERAATLQDRRTQRTCLINALSIASEDSRTMNDHQERKDLRQMYWTLLVQRLDFESRITNEALYLCFNLLQLGGAFVIRERSKPAEYLNLLKKFTRDHPDFGIPRLKERLYSIAENAAQQVGDAVSESEYRKLCHFALAESNPTRFVFNEFPDLIEDKWFHTYWRTSNHPDYWRSYQKVAAVCVCQWVLDDHSMGSLSAAEASRLLSSQDEIGQELSFGGLQIRELAISLYTRVFGLFEPASAEIWDPWFALIERWLRRTDLMHDSRLREELLVKIQLCRRDQFTNYLAKIDFLARKPIMPRLIFERRKTLIILESTKSIFASMDSIIDAKMLIANAYEVYSELPNVKEEALISDEMLAESFELLKECIAYYKETNRLDNLTRCLHWSAQCCWSRHYHFSSIPITDAFPLMVQADEVHRQIRMENYILKGSRSYIARHSLAETQQTGLQLALAIRYSLRALLQKLLIRDNNVPTEFSVQLLKHNLAWWVQRSKAQSLTEMLGLDVQLPASILPDPQQQPTAFRLVQSEREMLNELAGASIPEQVQTQSRIESVRAAMRREPSLLPIVRLREGASVDAEDIRAISSQLGPDIILVDWVYVLFADAWDLLLVTYRNGEINKFGDLSVKLAAVEKWTEEQLGFKYPLAQKYADYFLHRLDGLMTPLANVTSPGETLVFCPTKVLHRVPLHALNIGGQIAIERNPIVYCQSFSVLRFCQMSVNQYLHHPDDPFQATVFSPLPADPGLSKTLTEVADALGNGVLPCTDSPKQSFLQEALQASLIHFHGHSQLGKSNPLNQHLDFTGQAIPEEGKSPDDMLTADEVFDLRFKRPVHVTIMGCSSASSKVTDCDDLFGLSTALHYAGVSSIVSALWPVDSKDCLLFSKVFYSYLMSQMAKTDGSRTVNMARAMQAAVLALRASNETGSGEPKKPYHWAGLVLNGAWLFPKMKFPAKSSTQLYDDASRSIAAALESLGLSTA